MSSAITGTACNCMYGSRDPRCCIARARRQELVEAHRLGAAGIPLPPVDEPPPSIAHLNAINNGVNDRIARLNAIRL